MPDANQQRSVRDEMRIARKPDWAASAVLISDRFTIGTLSLVCLIVVINVARLIGSFL